MAELWKRQAWDTDTSFDRFQRYYLSQDKPRSLNEAYRRQQVGKGRQPGREKEASGSWRNWYQGRDYKGERMVQNDGQPVPTWEERARAYDDYLAEQERQKWEQRRLEQRERDWDLASKLAASAEKMADWPISKATITEYYEDGRPKVIIFEPVTWNKGDAARFAKTASDLGRAAADMAQSVDVTTGGAPVGVQVDLSGLSIEQLTALAQSLQK